MVGEAVAPVANNTVEEVKHASPLPTYSPSPPAPTQAVVPDDSVLDLSIKKDKAELESETPVRDTSAEVAEHFKKAGIHYDESVHLLFCHYVEIDYYY